MLFCFSLFPSLCLTSTLSAAPLSLTSLVVFSTAIQAVASEFCCVFFFFLFLFCFVLFCFVFLIQGELAVPPRQPGEQKAEQVVFRGVPALAALRRAQQSPGQKRLPSNLRRRPLLKD